MKKNISSKKKKSNPSKQQSLRFRYWEGWVLTDMQSGLCLFKIPKKDERVKQLWDEFLYPQEGKPETLTQKVNKLPDLLAADPDAVRDPRVNHFILHFKQMASYDDEAKRMFARIEKALHGDSRGRTDPKKLQKVIEQDLKDFKEMVEQRLKGHTVQDVIDGDPNKGLVWNHYIKPARVMLQGFSGSEESKEDWGRAFKYFEVIATNFHQPKFVGYYQFGESYNRWILVKG